MANTTPVATDQFKLTAIIADASGKKITAVIMDGERSYSVDQGDVVAGRKITKISNEAIFMENDSMTFFYDIYGKKGEKFKEGYQGQPSTLHK
jgi:type II secretory pathway component PulC